MVLEWTPGRPCSRLGAVPGLRSIVNGCAFHEWTSSMDLMKYMDERMRSVLICGSSRASVCAVPA